MDVAVRLLILGLVFGPTIANGLPEKQWLTQEDLNNVVNAIRAEYIRELADTKVAFRAEIDALKTVVGYVQDDLEKQKQVNERQNIEIENLRAQLAELKEQDGKEMAEQAMESDTLTESSIAKTDSRTNSISSKRRTYKHRRLVLDSQSEVGVAFTAILENNQLGENLGYHQTIHFDHIVSNLGNAFDQRLGTFTAPTNGWYVFSLTMMSRPNETQSLEVAVNGTTLFRCYSTGNEYNSVSRTVVAHLAQGDEVWARTQQAGTGASPNVHGGGHSSFTGWLLYAV